MYPLQLYSKCINSLLIVILNYIHNIPYRKMYEKESNLCGPQSANYSCCANYQSGYFGKPTKLRTLEPSMFQILTWNENGKEHGAKYNIERQCCNCKCGRSSEESYKQQNKPIQKQSENGFNPSNQPQRKAYQEQRKQKLSPQGRQLQHQNYTKAHKDVKVIINDKSEGQRNLTSQLKVNKSQQRPQSAGHAQKRVNHPQYIPKSPKFSTDKPEEPLQQQPLEVKEKLIEQFKQTTRWIPNSSFTTYFGKPAFENYGRGNTNPTYGGLMYGNYLKTHNIQPHRGLNSPKNLQSYNVALMKGQEAGAIYPYPPKVQLKQSAITENKKGVSTNTQSSCQIYQDENHQKSLLIYPPNLYELERFGGKGIQKVSRPKLASSKFEKENQYNQNAEQNRYIEGARRYEAY